MYLTVQIVYANLELDISKALPEVYKVMARAEHSLHSPGWGSYEESSSHVNSKDLSKRVPARRQILYPGYNNRRVSFSYNFVVATTRALMRYSNEQPENYHFINLLIKELKMLSDRLEQRANKYPMQVPYIPERNEPFYFAPPTRR